MGLGGTVLGGIIGGLIGGGFWGAAIGAGVGAYLTRDRNAPASSGPEPTVTRGDTPLHLIALFRSLGKIAKSDGVVSREEADFVKSLLNGIDGLFPEDRKELIAAFNDGKASDLTFEALVRDVAATCRRSAYPDLMKIYCIIAIADATSISQKKSLLSQAERIFGLPGYADRFFRENGIGGNTSSSRNNTSGRRSEPASSDDLDEAYATLGVTRTASDDEVKKAWRKKALEFHPDKIQGKGLSEAFINFANEQSRKINQAYEAISKARGLK